MSTILVIGASGFIGGRLTRALLADGHAVRCLARDPARFRAVEAAGCEIRQGDISDPASLLRAAESVRAVYVAMHTLSPQQTAGGRPRFMDIEHTGLQNLVAACRSRGVRRVVYVTSLGTAPDAPSEWLRERWRTEQLLLNSGLDATVIRPGYIVGVGGRGFDAIVSQAKRRIALTLGGYGSKLRAIALDDLVYYLGGVLDDPRAFRQGFDVGNDDVLTTHQAIDVVAEVLGRPHPVKIPLPLPLLGALAPIIERLSKLPRGAFRGLLDSLKTDGIGDPLPIRAILPRRLLSFRQAVARAVQ